MKTIFLFLVFNGFIPLILFAQDTNWFQKGLESMKPNQQLEFFTKSILQGNELSASYFCRANAKKTLGDVQGAIDDYSKCIEIDSTDAIAYINRANVRQSINDFDGALADFVLADKADSAEGKKICAACDLYWMKQDYLHALQCYKMGLHFIRDKASVYNNLACCYFALEDYPAALENYQKCIALQPDFVFGYLNIALVYFEQNDLVNAKKYLDHAKVLQPILEEGYSGVQKLRKGAGFFEVKRDYALELLFLTLK
jgi:tetratricopeptide (TPR) repeat protein